MKASGHKQSVVFFGSGPVAANCLELLLQHCTVEAVITKPRPPHHKYDVPVIETAKKHNLEILSAANRSELDELIARHEFASKVAILIDFGIIVGKKAIDAFPLGIINSHFSLLPEWRGADPITFAILSGQPKTGVSLMLIDEGMDTGKLLTRRSLDIAPDDTSISLTEKLIQLSNELLKEYLPTYVSGPLKPKNQPHPDRATYSRKLTKLDGLIDWSEPAATIERKVRAYQPWPRCYTTIRDHRIIVLKSHIAENKKTPLDIQCGDGVFLSIDELIAPSGKTMTGDAFLRGYLA